MKNFKKHFVEDFSDSNKNKNSLQCFPKYENEREKLLNIIRKVNANLEVTNETAICEKHWPKCFEKIKVFEKHRPKNTPAVWDGIPEARFPTNQSWWEQPREHTVVLGTDKKINLFCWKRQGTHDKLLNEIVQSIYSHSNSFMIHQCY